jgi:flagellar biosynthesis/type III secretory pathway protein FliH
MAVVNLFQGADLWADLDARVLAPDTFAAMQTAQQMLSRCRAHCDALEAQARTHLQQQEQLGRAQGLERASAEAARRLLGFERSHAESLAQRPGELADLVMVVLERLAPALAHGELIRVLACQAVEHAAQASRVLLKVHPDCVDDVELELDELRRRCAWLDSAEVVGVEGMREDECLLESPHGFVNASWQNQLSAIRSLIDALTATPP